MINSFLTEHIHIWTTAQELKTSNRGLSAGNQSLLGIKKLRELILELAVRGKLVPQDPDDEPASVLLKKIAEEKRRLIKEGKIKKQEVLPEVGEDEKQFDLPESWGWQKLGNLGYTQTGGTPSKNDNSLFGNDVPFIKPGDIYTNYIDYTNEGLSFKGVESLGRLANEGSILMVCIGTIGKCNTINRPCTFNQQINSISPYGICSTYLLLALNSKYFQDKAWEKSSSTTIAILNKGKWENIGIPVAPLSEQHRIVAKVDELMALCDELEKQQTASNTLHETLVANLLGSLTDAGNSDSFDEAWQRIENNFDTLFTTEHSIDKLKQTILQLAVMGKLVPQDPNDEPAGELLKKIDKEKARLVKEGKIKKQAPLPEIRDDEKPFELPEGWKFAKMDFICTLITDGTHLTPRYTESGRAFISAQNIKPFKFLPDKHRLVSEEDYQKYIQNRKPELGDILLTRVGAGIGEAAIIDNDLEFAIYVSVGLLKFNKENIFSNYLVVWLNSPLGRIHSEKNTYGKGVSQGNLNLSLIRDFPISIPPLAEQHRIVSKVDELFAICDTLKERIRQAKAAQNLLAGSVVEGALAK
jgi:type I restriction enzyme S subunit